MINRHVTFVQSLYSSILSDIADELPELRKEFDRDYLRLCSAIENQGLRFATIDMVDAGKHFDRCLDASRLTYYELPHMRPYRKDSVIPRLFRGLLKRVFDDSGCLLPTCDHTSIRALRQLYNAVKKLKMECEDERTYESVRSFFHVDSLVEPCSLDWGDDPFDYDRVSRLSFLDNRTRDVLGSIDLPQPGDANSLRVPVGLLQDLHFVSDVVASSFGRFCPEDWCGKHGPGAVSDRVGKSKYDFPTWPKKLESVFPMADFGFANLGLWADTVRDDDLANRFNDVDAPSNLISVPKTQKAPRLIASEPTAHQWCQQNIKNFIYSSIVRTPYKRTIHFNDQSFNKRAAMRASIDQKHWTIDLSEASDRVSCFVVERMFRRNLSLLDAFRAVRTRFISNKICSKQPKLYELRKFSTMGSALTFPIQSIIFANIVVACMLFHRKQRRTARNVEQMAREVLVFGDDLVVPSDVGHLVLGLLSHLGFKVNRSKTFGKGRFRESCGGDYYRGYDVTPTYALTYPDKRRLESIISCVATHNNFVRSGYARTAQMIRTTVLEEACILLPTMPIGSNVLCWESPNIVSMSGLRVRFNKLIYGLEARMHRVVTRCTLDPDKGISRLLQYFTEAPSPDEDWEGGVRERPKFSLKLGWVRVDQSTV